MSMGIYVRPVAPTGKHVGSGSRIKDALERTFGGFPLTLDESHVSRLRAMAAAAGESCYSAIADSIDQMGVVQVDYDT